MGEVHLARLSSMQGVEKYFAIKLLLPQFAEEQSVVDMFITEARIAARIAHPNVCQVFELGIEDDELFICMEYLRGIPVNSILKSHKPLNPLRTDIAVAIIQQACAGLQFAHELKDDDGNNLGVVHRDISPGNIFLTAEGTAKVLDFGVVKANDTASKTRTGVLKGKFGYMSPEQIMAKPVDRRSDVFSLGIVLFELLTNRRLFARESEYATLKAITESPITQLSSLRPDLPKELGEVVSRALTRDLDERFATMKEFSQALGQVMKSQGGVADATEIADYVQGKFAYQLGEIDKMLQAASLSVVPPEKYYTPKGTAKTEIIRDEPRPVSGDLTTEDVEPLDYGARPERRRSSGLIVALAIAGLAMSALAVAIFYQKYAVSEPAPPPVIVERWPNDPDPPDPDPVPVATVEDAGMPVEGEADAAPKKVKAHRCDSKKTTEARNRCYVSGSGRKLTACLTKHSATISNVSQLTLSFDLNKRGKVLDVGVAPPAVASSALGACVQKVAKKIRFGAQGEAIRFRIPLRINQRTPP
jgi:serine/threonine-protein kinase